MTSIKKIADLPKEPKKTLQDEEVSPIESCPYKDSEEDDGSEKKVIKEAFFTNSSGERITEIEDEEGVVLVLDSQNMSGEEVIIPMSSGPIQFKYKGQEIDPETEVLSVTISSDSEKIELEPFFPEPETSPEITDFPKVKLSGD